MSARRELSTALLSLVFLQAGVSPAAAPELTPAATRSVLPGAVQHGAARLIAPLPASQRIRFDMTLALSHPSELRAFLAQLYKRSSPQYRHFLTPQQFTERFGPTQAHY